MMIIVIVNINSSNNLEVRSKICNVNNNNSINYYVLYNDLKPELFLSVTMAGNSSYSQRKKP
jgi:hypothetical protein